MVTERPTFGGKVGPSESGLFTQKVGLTSGGSTQGARASFAFVVGGMAALLVQHFSCPAAAVAGAVDVDRVTGRGAGRPRVKPRCGAGAADHCH